MPFQKGHGYIGGGIKKGQKFINSGQFKKGSIPYNTGKHHSEETKRKISKSKKGIYPSEETIKKLKECHKGEKSYLWKGGISKVKGYHSIYGKRYRVRKFNAEGSHTQGEWENLKIQYGYKCPMCERIEPQIKLTEDHIIPLSKGGSDFIENIQPLCQSCNSKKYNKIINSLK
jgi:5-methylcytosine-specific restriction endonuclease McrA